jgi:hypothetical protein
LKSDVVISGNHNDELHLIAFTDGSKHAATIRSFKLPFGAEDEGANGDVGIVIVKNMLLTGFDAPVEQVMYLDNSPIFSRPTIPCATHFLFKIEQPRGGRFYRAFD